MISARARELVGKLNELGEVNFKRHKTLPVLSKATDQYEWNRWRAWRERNGLTVALMDISERWTVPCFEPPDDIDAALREAQSSGRKGRGKLADRLHDDSGAQA